MNSSARTLSGWRGRKKERDIDEEKRMREALARQGLKQCGNVAMTSQMMTIICGRYLHSKTAGRERDAEIDREMEREWERENGSLEKGNKCAGNFC